MAFETGTVSNTFELTRKIHNFIAEKVPGWQLWSNIDGYGTGDAYDGYHMVYRSVGSSGRNEIYLHMRVGPVELFQEGADFYDWDGRGNTGYVTFQSYVSFPKDGDAYAGYSGIGQFGTRFYHRADSGGGNMWNQSMLSVNKLRGGGQHHLQGLSENSPAQDAIHPRTEENNAFTRMTSSGGNNSGSISVYTPFTTDGENKIWLSKNVADFIGEYDIRRNGGRYDLNNITSERIIVDPPGFDGGGTVEYIVYYIDRDTGVPYLLAIGDLRGETAKYNLIRDAWESVADIPPWPNRNNNPSPNFNPGGGICWDGGKYIYMIRGNSPDWARYDIPNDTWRVTTDELDPKFREFPQFISSSLINFYDKRISGFQFHRLYVYDPGNTVYYMEIDDNGLPHPGKPEWTPAGEIAASSVAQGNYQFIFLRSGRVLMFLTEIGSTADNLFETFTSLYDSRLIFHSFGFSETENISFETNDSAFFPQQIDRDGSFMLLFDGYMSRVKTAINATTEYAILGDEDRLIVATKARKAVKSVLDDNPQWSIAYIGAFESEYSSTPYGELLEDVQKGFSKEIKLKNIDGEFIPNNKYFIINTTTNMGYEEVHFMEGSRRKLVNSELIKVTKVSGNTLTASLKNSYPAGSKIAIDPQPVGVYFGELEKFQATNIAQRRFDYLSGSFDPSQQTYTVSTPNAAVDSNAISTNIRSIGIPLWPMIISTAEGEGELGAREVRGKLKGMYTLGEFETVDGGETIAVGNDVYFILKLPGYQTLVAFGPINE